MAKEYTYKQVIDCNPDRAYSLTYDTIVTADLKITGANDTLGLIKFETTAGFFSRSAIKMNKQALIPFVETTRGIEFVASIEAYPHGSGTLITITAKNKRTFGFLPTRSEITGEEAPNALENYVSMLNLVLSRKGIEYQPLG